MFKIKLLVVVLALLSAPFAYSNFELPPLSTDEEKLAFLLQVRREIPKLFVDAAKYDIDLFTLLDNEAELVAQLKKYPKFEELYSGKKYVNINVRPVGDIWVGQVEIKPEAIEAWKQSILEKIEKARIEFPTPPGLLTGVNTKDILSFDPLEVLNKIGFIVGKGKNKAEQKKDLNNQIKIFKTQNSILERCKKEQPQLIEKFRCISQQHDALQGLTNLLPKDDIDGIIRGIYHEQRVFPLLYLAAVLKKNPNTPVQQDWDQFRNSIAQLNSEDLIHLNDKNDVLKPVLVTYFNGENDPRLVRALHLIHKEINQHASQTISHQTKVSSPVELVEVPPEIGIFRGCIGGDCSSQYSFAYPNDPHERVFYIKTKKPGGDLQEQKLKGYVSTTEVMVGEEKALYVITISGAQVSAEDVELIFRGFEKAKETLDVKHIILPTLENLASLINFPAIRGAYEDHIRKSNHSMELVYQDKDIRYKIEQYKPLSGYNKGGYDYSDRNKNGMVLSIKNNPVAFTITYRPASQNKSYSLDSLSLKEDLFEFIRELRISRRNNMMDRVLNTFGEEGSNIIKNLFVLLDSCKEPAASEAMNIQQFKTNISDGLRNLGLGEDYLDRNSHLMVPGYFKCEGAFSKENLEQAAMLVANDIKNYENKSILFPLIESHLTVLNTTLAFNKLNHRYYEKLSNPDAETRKTAITIFRKTRPADPEIHKALAKALSDPNWLVSQDAAKALELVQPTDQGALLEIVALLQQEKSGIRAKAAELLLKIKPRDPEIHRALAKVLSDPNIDIRTATAEVLLNIHSADPEIQKSLVRVVGDPDWWSRNIAASILAEIKPADQEDILEIAALLQHGNLGMRLHAAKVLTEIRFGWWLSEGEDIKNLEILKALGFTLPDIARLLRHRTRDWGLREDASTILGANKPADPEIHMELVRALSDPFVAVQNAAADALKRIQPTKTEVLLEVAKLVRHEDSNVRFRAAMVLLSSKPPLYAEGLIQLIEKLKKNESLMKRLEAL